MRRTGNRQLETGNSRFDKFPKNCPARLQFMLQPQHRQCNLPRSRPGNADNAYAAASGRSCDGDNCVIEVHGPIVAVKLEGQPAAPERSVTRTLPAAL